MRLYPYNISQKLQVVVEHFRETVAPLLGGRAKAMAVTASRQEVVRWQLAIARYISERGYGIGTLVAFSGEVRETSWGRTASRTSQPEQIAAVTVRMMGPEAKLSLLDPRKDGRVRLGAPTAAIFRR